MILNVSSSDNNLLKYIIEPKVARFAKQLIIIYNKYCAWSFTDLLMPHVLFCLEEC